MGRCGVACNIPAVHRHDRDCPCQTKTRNDMLINGSTISSGIFYQLADEWQLESADRLLTVLSDAVSVRVTCQDARCHRCLTD